MSSFIESRRTLIKYLKLKTEQADWHGVSDAANDLRVLEAEHSGNVTARVPTQIYGEDLLEI